MKSKWEGVLTESGFGHDGQTKRDKAIRNATEISADKMEINGIDSVISDISKVTSSDIDWHDSLSHDNSLENSRCSGSRRGPGSSRATEAQYIW